MAALKSFYRNHDGEILPFDSHRGGKHYFRRNRRKRVKYEHVPNRKEVYQIASSTSNWRDRAIVLVLFQSGIRANALCRLTYGMVRQQLKEGKIPLRLHITDDIDTKLRGYSIEFYDTFLGKEAIEALKKYCQLKHPNSNDGTPLFKLDNDKAMNINLVWANIKKCIVKTGFDKRSITVHTLRKAFKRAVRQADIDDDFKEAIMGHVLPQSRENYFSRNAPEEIEQEYMKIDFSKEGRGVEFKDLTEKMESLKEERETLTPVITEQSKIVQKLKEKVEQTEGVGRYIDALYEHMDRMNREIAKLKGEKPKPLSLEVAVPEDSDDR